MSTCEDSEIFGLVKEMVRNRAAEYPMNFDPAQKFYRALLKWDHDHIPHMLNHLVREAVRVGREEERGRILAQIKKD